MKQGKRGTVICHLVLSLRKEIEHHASGKRGGGGQGKKIPATVGGAYRVGRLRHARLKKKDRH